MARPFRFGVNRLDLDPGLARRAEELGYDLLLAPDHLGFPAPFPALVAAAHATERLRVGTFVLNAGFHRPSLLARDVATTDRLTGGRLELGLGAGYVKEEFDRAGLDYGTPGDRMAHLTTTVEQVRSLLADPEHVPAPVQQPVPLLLGGHGPRMLALAAEHADTVGFTGATQDAVGNLALVDADQLEARVRGTRETAERHGRDPELNVLVQQVLVSDVPREQTARELHEQLPSLTAEQILEVPTLAFGTADEIARQFLRHRNRFGFTNITVLGPFMEPFGEIIPRLRELDAGE